MQELSLNILDVAENSVKAGAKQIAISVQEDTAADRLTIVIQDDGCGMTSEQVQQVVSPFYTTRTTRKVGLGIPFFKMAAELTGGGLTVDSQVGVGTTVTAVFGLSHIDRMPLGDLAGTVGQLIQTSPEIDFVFTYARDGRQFVADTREFRQLLEGVPLSSPEVALFLRDYLREQIAEIQRP